MRRHGFLALLLAGGFAASGAGLTCGLTATPQTIASEGLAEQAGDILLRCSGGTPGGVVSGTVYVALSHRVANRIAGEISQGVTVLQDVMGSWAIVPSAVPRPYNNGIAIEGVRLTLDLSGSFGMKISGIRTDSGAPVSAFVQFIAGEQIMIMTPQVTVAAGTPSLFATLLGAVAAPCNAALPSIPDVVSLNMLHLPVATTRVTEGWGEAFRAAKAGEDQGTRFVIRFSNVPKGARLIAPDAVAGSSAILPTSSGLMGSPATGGVHTPYTAAGQLLLARVRDADEKGQGGMVFWIPAPGPQVLLRANEIDWGTSGPYVVYEVMDSNLAAIENAQIPVWIWLPQDWVNIPVVIHQTVNLAPMSETPGPQGGPIPRYRPVTPPSDCVRLGDCSAAFFPKMLITPSGETNFTAVSGGPAQAGYILVHNVGGNVLEWDVRVRYKQGKDWIQPYPAAGLNDATVRYIVLPKDLAPGRYEAEMVFKYYGSPSEEIVPITLLVTIKPAEPPQPPAPAPAPSIAEVVNAGSLLPGPVAPGALMVIRGTRLEEVTQASVRGVAARVILAVNGELVVEVPPDIQPSGKASVVVSTGGLQSLPYDIDITPVWPSVLYVLNEDGEKNSDEYPAAAGRNIGIYVTGLRLAATALEVLLHDVTIEAKQETTDQPGVALVKVTVPEYLPEMKTAFRVCGTAGGDKVCSHPRDIWLKRP